eukprot:367002-Pyramimonas_sp.AAC.1
MQSRRSDCGGKLAIVQRFSKTCAVTQRLVNLLPAPSPRPPGPSWWTHGGYRATGDGSRSAAAGCSEAALPAPFRRR